MAMSMTGFGRGTAEDSKYHITIEAKSVNHRFLEIYIRSPRAYQWIEDRIRASFQAAFSRGKIEIHVQIRMQAQEIQSIRVNYPLLEGYLKSCSEIKDRFGIEGDICLQDILHLEGVFQPEEDEDETERINSLIDSAAQAAILGLKEMRKTEGAALVADLEGRLSHLNEEISLIEKQAQNLPAIYRDKLKKRLAELLDGQTIDENRIALEVVLYTDRSAIDEEIVRFYSHIQQFRQTIVKNDPIGRRLDFLVQELNREANTIGSKAGDLAISHSVVEIKTEIEKIREQIQNIE
jgi:uncharacterized protein (TIGR00255 family)